MLGIGALLADERDEVDEPVRVAPLVVVPAEHLHHACRWPSCRRAEKMHDDGLPTMSADTSGSSLYSSTPRYDVSFGGLRERGVDLVDRDARGRRFATRSVIEPVGVGTRSDVPSSLPLSSGSTSPIAVRRAGGARDDRQRRRRACGAGRACRCGSRLGQVLERWSLVYACTVVMRPCSMPNRVVAAPSPSARGSSSCTTRSRSPCAASASKTVVVHAHADRRVGVAARRRDDDALGAAARGAPAAFSRAVKRPVDSMTTSTSLSPHGISAGSVTSSFVISRAVDREAVVGRLDLVGQRAADGVVLQQERHRVRVAERVVHRDELDAGRLAAGEERPGERAADAAEAVDARPVPS